VDEEVLLEGDWSPAAGGAADSTAAEREDNRDDPDLPDVEKSRMIKLNGASIQRGVFSGRDVVRAMGDRDV